jgi:cytochrome c55X
VFAGGALGPTLVSADVGAKDDEFLRETISNGRTGTAMPPWGGILSAQDVEDVISFLRSKQP